MLITLFNYFVKLTGWLPQKICFRTKIHYEDKAVQGRKIKGAAVLISNHTSVFDYAVLLFVFPLNTLRVLMAEVLYKKKFLAPFLKAMGGIYVNRDAHNLGFMTKSGKVLKKGGVVGVFPEGRLPIKGEVPPLPFKEGAALLALSSNVPVVPVFTDGSYFNLKKRANVIIGTPIYPENFATDDERESVDSLNRAMRDKIIALEKELNGRKEKS